MVIAGSVNKTFGPWKINGPTIGWDGAHGPREQTWVAHYPWTVGALQMVSELVSHLISDLRGVLRPVMGRNEDVAFFERG